MICIYVENYILIAPAASIGNFYSMLLVPSAKM